MKKSTIASLIGLAFSAPTFAADNINLDDVVVTASRVPQPRESVIADVTVINAEQIQSAGQSTFIELLQTQPGIEISSNGGAGKTSSIFMRGTNGGHVVVLVDGMRIMSATAGSTTWENLPLGLVDRVEILRGPAVSLYGQDAIGGVIQIFTKKGDGQTKFYANLGYGSYQTTKADAGVYGRINDTSYALSLTGTKTNGFSSLDTNKPNFNDKDGYRNLAFSANLSQKLAKGHEIGFQLLNSDGHTRFDNRFNEIYYPANANFSSNAKLNQQSVAIFSKNQFTSFWLSNLRVGLSKDKSKTYDASNIPSFDRFDTEQDQINWQNDFSLPVGTLTLMYDRLEDDVISTTAFDKTNRVNEGYVASYLANVDAHSVQLSLREDHNSQFGSNVTGGIGYGFSFNDHWRTTASYGSAFKAPTFNDLYYPFFSNPNLKPEKSDNIEASLRYQNSSSHISATVYDNHIRDLIAFDLTTFTIENVNKARIKGLTLAGGQRIGNLNIDGSLDIQSPRDENSGNLLVRRANRIGKLNLSYDLGNWRFGSEFIASSLRYNDNANNNPLSGYGLLNLTTSYKINNDWSAQARINNVLDKNYALAFDGTIPYNTPGANLFVNIRYQPE